MGKLQTQIISFATVVIVGLTIVSLANATTPAERKAQSEAFLAQNAKKPNIITTKSGLQYEVLQKGSGTVSPAASDNATVHYRGTTIEGNEFDSSYGRGEPITFPLSGVIAGWTEGVQLMTEGAKYRFYIPAELAYGERGAGPIGPNEALIFDVELIKIL